MEYREFFLKTISALPVGKILPNPGGGTTKINAYTDADMIYKRGNSLIHVSMLDLYSAYKTFSGKAVSSTDLRDYAPKVFDSSRNGHSCNCTLLFMILKSLGIVTKIDGKGKKGNPFRITIPPQVI